MEWSDRWIHRVGRGVVFSALGLLFLTGSAGAGERGKQIRSVRRRTWLGLAEEIYVQGDLPGSESAGVKGHLECEGVAVAVEDREGSSRRASDPPNIPDGGDRWSGDWYEVPGPPPAGKAEHAYLHWLDYEAFSEKPLWIDARVRHYCRSGVAGQAEGMEFTRQDLSLKYSAGFATGLIDEIALQYRSLSFHSRPRLPDTGQRFPRQLMSAQLGLQMIALLPLGLYNVTIGSASDRPFASGDEMTADVTWVSYFPSPDNNRSAFTWFVNYQNNRDFLNRCVLPGFVWRRRWEDRLTLSLGFPFNSFAWRPTPSTYLGATYKFPRTVHAKAAWTPVESIEFYAAFDWTSQRYFRHDRRGLENRLWYLEKTLSAGVRWRIADGIFLDASGGWAFDRFWFEGKTYEDRDFNRIDLSDGPFLGLWFGGRF